MLFIVQMAFDISNYLFLLTIHCAEFHFLKFVAKFCCVLVIVEPGKVVGVAKTGRSSIDDLLDVDMGKNDYDW